MNITLSGTKVSMDGHTLAFQKNNLVDSMVITVDTDETWQYKLDVKYPCKDSKGEELYNVIDLTRVGNTCTAILQASMLPFNGKYTMQLRGVSGDKVYHTDTFDVWVKYSIDLGKVYDPVPSEFYQIEQAVTEQAANAKQSATESAESATNAAASATKAENAVVHSPIVGENGNWFIWDFEKSEYVDSGTSASGTPPITPDTAGKYLTNDGSKAEWGVMSGGSDLSLGITGAQVGQLVKITEVDTDGKPTKWKAVNDRLPNVSPAENGKALYVEQIGEFEYGYGFTRIPDIHTFIPLGITGASPGQFSRIKFVDDIGQPTAWEAVDIPSGGSDISLGLTAATVGQTVVVKAVDADGKPTEWEAVDMAGGGGTWELINEITLDDAVNFITINQDANGNAFALKRVMIDCVIQPDTADLFTYIKTKINGYVSCNNSKVKYENSDLRYYAFYAEIIPGSGALCWHTCSGRNCNWESYLEKMGYKYNGLWSTNAITSIEIGANDGAKNIGIAGTVVHVMGVRA